MCCGTQREADKCAGCSFYQPPRRKYGSLPAYALDEMDGDFTLEERANSIESALVGYDIETNNKPSDAEVITILDQLLNVYHFGDDTFSSSSETVNNGAHMLRGTIAEDMPDVANDEIAKIICTVRASAKRRTKYGRDYLTFISQYVGNRVGSGMRLVNAPHPGLR